MSEETTELQEEVSANAVAPSDPPSELPSEAPARPEWLLEKYKTVEDQAKAYIEAQKLIGKRETKAPEQYTVSVPEELEGIEVDESDPTLGTFLGVAKELNLPQEAVDRLLGVYLISEKAMLDEYEAEEAARMQREKQALGARGEARIRDIEDWAAQHLTKESFEAMRGFGITAAGVKMLEEFRGIGREHGLPVTEVRGSDTARITPEDISKMQFEKDANGNRRMSTDPAFRKEVERLARQVYGAAPRQDLRG